MFSFALVSNKLIPICSANFCASVVSTTLELGSSFLFPTKKQKIFTTLVPRLLSKVRNASNCLEIKIKTCSLDWGVERTAVTGLKHTHLIFGTRRHSSGWFHVTIVWRWQKTQRWWRHIPLWPHAFPCNIFIYIYKERDRERDTVSLYY